MFTLTWNDAVATLRSPDIRVLLNMVTGDRAVDVDSVVLLLTFGALRQRFDRILRMSLRVASVPSHSEMSATK